MVLMKMREENQKKFEANIPSFDSSQPKSFIPCCLLASFKSHLKKKNRGCLNIQSLLRSPCCVCLKTSYSSSTAPRKHQKSKILHISLSFAFLYLPNPHVHPFILGVVSPAPAHQSPAHFLLSPSHTTIITTIINTIITTIIPHRYCDHHHPISPPLTPSPL